MTRLSHYSQQTGAVILRRALKDKRTLKGLLKCKPITVGYGIRQRKGLIEGELVLKVFVKEKLSSAMLKEKKITEVPKELQFSQTVIPTDVCVLNKVHALVNLKERFRPLMGGPSIGHPRITAGTTSVLVKTDLDAGKDYHALSNAHVVAACNDGAVGDQVYQPGPYDGGQMIDTYGNLSFRVLLSQPSGGDWWNAFWDWLLELLRKLFGGTSTTLKRDYSFYRASNGQGNYQWARAGVLTPTGADIEQPYPNLVDAALVRASDQGTGWVTPKEIIDIGSINGTTIGEDPVGLLICGTGRTTGYREAQITAIITGSLEVDYGDIGILEFTDVLIAEAPSGTFMEPGDSGKLWVTRDTKRVAGLGFAGGTDDSTGKDVAVACRVEHLVDYLKLRF